MSAPNEVRHLVDGRFVIGAHPDRPAPAHLFNNFVLRAFGKGDGADRVRQYSRDSEAIDRLANHPAIRMASWAEDRDLLATLADTIWIVFDPDRRVFPSFGSPFPIDKRLATPDPSDDGLGRALWESLSGRQQLNVRARLAEILDSESSADPASQLSQFLLEDVVVSTSPEVDDNSTPEFPLLGGTIDTLIKGIGEIHNGAERLEAIRQLGTALGLVVFTGLPPGDGDDPLVKAAQLSYRATLADVHSGLRDNLNARLTGELDPTVPAGVRLQSALLGMLRQSDVTSPQKALDRILSVAPAPPNTDQSGIEEWLDTLMTEGYPIEHLSRGLRAMANKVGFVGPVRGFGQPRFVLETPLLATLARALVATSGSMAFDDFVRAMRTQLGLIVGINQRDKIPAGARVFGSDQVARQRLGVLGERLRLRLIQAGLAREFSDSHTRVFAT
jgi:hypothetical protein